MTLRSLSRRLEKAIGAEVRTQHHPQSARILMLRSVATDLEIGAALQEVKGKRPTSILVETGIRLPIVEATIDAYEIEQMRAMGFKNPEAVGWLTFWKPVGTSSPEAIDDRTMDLIGREMTELEAAAARALKQSDRFFHEKLAEGIRPSWATMPRSSALLIRALACEPSLCSQVSDLVARASDLSGYEENVYRFVDWLKTVNRPETSGGSDL